MSFVLKIYKDCTDDEPLQIVPVTFEEASEIHDRWEKQGYLVGLYPQIDCGPACPFKGQTALL